MILQFSVSNFRAFRGIQTLNLSASNYDKTLAQNCISPDLAGLKNRRWLKGAALYGPNASGKSSIIEALKALANLVRNSAKTTDPKEIIRHIEPFALEPDEAVSPTAFGIVFVSDSVRYEYRLAATKLRVWHESLRAFPSGKEQLWFCRDWQSENESYTWAPERPTGYQRDTKKQEFTLPNVLFLSKAISLGDTQLEPVFRWFQERLRFLDLSTKSMGMGDTFTAQQFTEKTPLAPRILELLRHADLGVVDASVREEKLTGELLLQMDKMLTPEMKDRIKDAVLHNIELSHRGPRKQVVPLPWAAESAGTHRLFGLAGPWLDILQEGYTVCIDELETSMHPIMVAALLRLVFSEKENRGGAQILFTTHNPLLLDPTLLRRDQVWFTDKDEQGESHLYPLSDYQPRRGESLVRGYLTGRYGAVPFIPEGLLGSFPAVELAVEGGNDGR